MDTRFLRTLLCLLCVTAFSASFAKADCQLALLERERTFITVTSSWGLLPRSIELPRPAIAIAASAENTEHFYIAEGGDTPRIARVSLDGTNYAPLISREVPPLAITVHEGFIYWSEDTPDEMDKGQGKIYRARLDGNDVEELVTGITNPRGISLSADGRIFWIAVEFESPFLNLGPAGVFSATTGGDDLQQVLDLNSLAEGVDSFSGVGSLPVDIVVDSAGGKLYVADQIDNAVFTPRIIWRSNLDGSDAEVFTRYAGCTGVKHCHLEVLTIRALAFDASRGGLIAAIENQKFGGISRFADDGTSDLVVRGSTADVVTFGQSESQCASASTLSGSSTSDFAVWRPSLGSWFALRNSEAEPFFLQQWGLPGDIPLLGNFNGTGLSDLAVWRPSEGNWYLCDWNGTGVCAGVDQRQFGLFGDFPIAADFDGDNLTDLTVWRPSNGTWYHTSAMPGSITVQQWGLRGDLPLVADFNADGRDDYVIFRPDFGLWAILYSGLPEDSSTEDSTMIRQWGLPQDFPLIGDYDGDSRPDLVVWRPKTGVWYICPSTGGYDCAANGTATQFGLPGDIPVVADFDGDSINDLVVWRPSEGNWYYRSSSSETIRVRQWGLPGDLPIGYSVRALVQ